MMKCYDNLVKLMAMKPWYATVGLSEADEDGILLYIGNCRIGLYNDGGALYVNEDKHTFYKDAETLFKEVNLFA